MLWYLDFCRKHPHTLQAFFFFPFFWEIWMQFLKVICGFFQTIFSFSYKIIWPFDDGNITLIRQEISAWAAVHTRYVMDAWDRVYSKIFLPRMVRTPSVFVALTKLRLSEPEHWVTWSHRTGVNFLNLSEKRIQYFSVSA